MLKRRDCDDLVDWFAANGAFFSIYACLRDGYRSTRAVKNPENWRKAQMVVRNSSFVFGGVQLVFTLLICSWSEDLFLIANAVFLGVLLGIQFFYVNSRLD